MAESGDGSRPPKKLIIDTDPGIDDTMAILLAFQSPKELQVLALTTIFGNVRTPTATANALRLCELAGRADVVVAHGEEKMLSGDIKVRVADFVHGTDGLGETHLPPSSLSPSPVGAVELMLQLVKQHPHQVTVVALGPLTNVARAIQSDPSFSSLVREVVVLGGAFFTSGNVNPAAEANVFGDVKAADVVFTSGANVTAIGINITHQVTLTVKDMEDIRDSDSAFGRFIYDTSQFYYAYHKRAYNMDAVYLHDPSTIVAAMLPGLFTFQRGAVRVQQEGITKGLTLFNNTDRKWPFPTAWCGQPSVSVAMTVDADQVRRIVKDRLSAPRRI